jgi:tyrosinase
MADNRTRISRRSLIAAGAATAAAALVARVPARAQGPARWRRYNVASADGQRMLGYYQTAIAAMLKLPPDDPRNWYRLAFTHYLDCPHGNWWLFPWHRALTGWAEQIVRKFSGFDGFAFPYWDWTANPSIPGAFYSQPLLNPSNDAFINQLDTFQRRFKPALAATDYWSPNSIRSKQLQVRGIGSNEILWDQLTDPQNQNYPSFFPVPGFPNVRNPNPALDCVAGNAVSQKMLTAAMAPQDYMTFSSPEADQHSQLVGFAVLENQPHNKVHNNTGGIVYPSQGSYCNMFSPSNNGGFMQAFLSPTDPLFYMHHSNIDRLWEAWSQKTAPGNRLPPAGPAYDKWAREPFLFFVDADGRPVTQVQAGSYATIGAFNYDYQPGGSVGTTPPPTRSLRAAARPPVRRFAGEIPPAGGRLFVTGSAGATAVRLQPALVQLARPGAPQQLLAKVTLSLPHAERGQVFQVLVHTGDPASSVEAGTVALFGHTMVHGMITFTVPLSDAIATLRSRNALRTNGYLHFRAAGPGSTGHHAVAASAPRAEEVRVHSVIVEAH